MKIQAGDIDFDSLENDTYYAVQVGIRHSFSGGEKHLNYYWKGFDTQEEAGKFFERATKALETEDSRLHWGSINYLDGVELTEVVSLTKFTIKKEKLR